LVGWKIKRLIGWEIKVDWLGEKVGWLGEKYLFGCKRNVGLIICV
jgi:hypothetical protein